MAEHTAEDGAAPVRVDLVRLLDLLSVAVADTGIPQVTLARRTGLTEKHISQMMTGRVNGSVYAWSNLLDAAGLALEVRVIPPAESAES